MLKNLQIYENYIQIAKNQQPELNIFVTPEVKKKILKKKKKKKNS